MGLCHDMRGDISAITHENTLIVVRILLQRIPSIIDAFAVIANEIMDIDKFKQFLNVSLTIWQVILLFALFINPTCTPSESRRLRTRTL
jgi:hypothetical protein